MVEHCGDNAGDRSIGDYWERQFCQMAESFGFIFTAHQLHKSVSATYNGAMEGTLPDVTIWCCPAQHHEIKHKDPTRSGCYGLEVYRFEALKRFANLTGEPVYYTIHDHHQAGGKHERENRLSDWCTAQVCDLDGAWTGIYPFPSYVNGERRDRVPTYLWPVDLWQPLDELWESIYQLSYA